MNVIDQAFGISPQVLAVRARRTEIIAANLANADTPNFKARDLDFKAALATARGEGGMRRTDDRHMVAAGGSANSSELLYRTPSQPSLDGNTVDTDREHMAFMDNAIRYQASLNFLDGRLRGLLLALRGE